MKPTDTTLNKDFVQGPDKPEPPANNIILIAELIEIMKRIKIDTKQ